MSSRPPVAFQPDLFDAAAVRVDARFARLERIWLDETAWVDFAEGWVEGSDALFEQVLAARTWRQRTRWMYDRRLSEPRLTAHWSADSGEPLAPAIVETMRRALSARYRVEFDSVGFNLYRDGADSVAWHGDKITTEIAEPIVALVGLGERRRLLLRPKGGGRSHAFPLGRGDLLVTGGTTQRTWEHSIPKVKHAGPRISIAFRYGLDPRAYGRSRKTH